MINSATFAFLKELKENNNREWFNANKARHEEAKINVLEFVSNLIPELAKIDKSVPASLNAKDCVMRIYRDIRFSLNKTPYKTNFGAGISPNGKNFKGPGYYIHIEPNNSFVAGGSWFPENNELKAIRQEIDYNYSSFEGIIEAPDFKNYYGSLDQEGALKTAPKGYSANHPYIHILKLKSFTVSSSISNDQLQSNGSVKIISEGFEYMYPFINFLRNAIA
jgi:uncharacterized protein (TIGR02453 family)